MRLLAKERCDDPTRARRGEEALGRKPGLWPSNACRPAGCGLVMPAVLLGAMPGCGPVLEPEPPAA